MERKRPRLPKYEKCGSSEFQLVETLKLTRQLAFQEDTYTVLSEEYDAVNSGYSAAVCIGCSQPYNVKELLKSIQEYEDFGLFEIFAQIK